MKKSLRISVVVLGLFASVGRAVADESAAHSLLAAGIAAREKGDYRAALQLFQQAHQLEPSPMTLGQMGSVEYFLGRWEDTDEHLRAALANPSDSWVVRYRPMIDKALGEAREHLGELALIGGAPGAQVFVNGRMRGVLPLAKPLRITAGEAAVQVTAAGFQPFVGSTTVMAGITNTLSVTMEKLRLVETPAAAAGANEEGSSKLRVAAWAAGAAAVAGVGVGIVGQLVRNGRLDDFNRSCRLDATNGNKPTRYPAGGTTADPCQGLYDSWNSSKPWPIIGYSAAGALAVTSAVLFLVSRSEPATEKRIGMACGLGIGFASCGGVF
jgi:hypothetical protein